MLPLLLALSLAAARPASPAPVAPKEASFVLFVRSPRAGLPQLRAFLTEAGAYAPSLKPAPLGNSLGALLGADLTDVAALEGAGVDVEAPLTISFVKSGTLTCFAIKGDKAQKRMEATLAGAGPITTRKHKGAQLTGATAGKTWRSGFAIRKNLACTVGGTNDALPLLELAVSGMSAGIAASPAFASATAGMQGPLLGWLSSGETKSAFELIPNGKSLTARGLVLESRRLLDKPKDADPLANLKVPAALVVTATLTRSAMTDHSGPAADAIRFLVGHACARCGHDVARSFLDALAPHAFGSIGLVVAGIDPTPAGALSRYYLFPHTYLLPLTDAAAGAKALRSLADKITASGTSVTDARGPGSGPHLAIKLGERQVYVGLAGSILYLSNELGARDLALAALHDARPGKPAHALVLSVDGPVATSALRRISILDAPKSPELASLFALGVEGGSLLKAAGDIPGFADPAAKGARFEISLQIGTH